MSKPLIQNIITTQTFQNWFDKTNEMVDIMRDSAVTASVTGDTTTGDTTIIGEFTANNVVVFNELLTDYVEARTPASSIAFASPITITPSLSPIAATFTYGASGGRTRYTDGTLSWDIGFDNSTAANFEMNHLAGGQFSLSPAGVLTVPSIVTSADITIGTSLTVDQLIANNAVFTTASGAFAGTLTGNVIGDVYAPNGTTKVFENGNGTNIPATFTGNVNGTVSSLTNHKTTNLVEGTNLYYTDARAQAAITASTGVTVTGGVISIGQSVGTTANVTFGAGGTEVAVSANGQLLQLVILLLLDLSLI